MQQDFNNKVTPSRHYRILALEILFFALTALGVISGLINYSLIPILFVFAWLSLRLRQLGWHDVGLTIPKHWLVMPLLGIFIGAFYQLLSIYWIEPAVTELTGQTPDYSVFEDLPGNLKFLAGMLVISWSYAALGEELIFRGYLLNRVADFIKGGRGIWIAAAILSSAVFSLGHAYQGVAGIINSGLFGLAMAFLYLATRRNLWAPIIAHGTANTLGFTLLYLQIYPA